jgi:hypothetical protein
MQRSGIEEYQQQEEISPIVEMKNMRTIMRLLRRASSQ